MISDKAKIESVLNNGRRILSERPELANMSLGDVLNELDDGTQQMKLDRWGVTAWLVIRSISNFELPELINDLCQIESGLLTYEYTGYLLQAECGVNLEALILDAEQCGQFDKIAPYVIQNLIFEVEVHTQYIQQILFMLENHVAHRNYHQFITNYSKHVTDLGAHRTVEEILGDLSGKAQYDLMRNLRWSWYRNNQAEASDVIGRMIERGSIWSKKAAIDFLEVSINYEKEVFRNHFSEMENMLAESEELWLMIIPVFVKYVMDANDKETQDDLNHQTLEYLKIIPSSSINAKYSFLESIQCKEETPEDLQAIFHAIISQPCGKDQRLLDLLDQILHTQLQKGDWKAAMQAMLETFSVNHYQTNYRDFFEAMHSVDDLISKHVDEITIQALKYILSCDVDWLFFGLGLLMNVGRLKNIQNKDYSDSICLTENITDAQMIRIMKAVLYYGFDDKKICHMAFQLLVLSEEPNEKYLVFCMKEVYGNYPVTMHEVAAQYGTSNIVAQANLADTVKKAYDRSFMEQKHSYDIKDLHPSREHQYIYQRALLEQNRRIKKSVNEQSIYANLSASRYIKYGVRSAHIVTGRENQKLYQVTPYQHFEYKVEKPTIYVKDPVNFELQRRAYLSEVTQDETDS